MRTAFISDIHSNAIALAAVLTELRTEGVDQVVCLGDVANLGPQPQEVLALLQDLKPICVLGNHDEDVLEPALVQRAPAWIREVTAWSGAQMTAQDQAFLRAFQPTHALPLAIGLTALCFHGSPQSNLDFLNSQTTPEALDTYLKGTTAPLLVGGHTHEQLVRQHRGRWLINAGSVGMPFEAPWSLETGPRLLPWAEYALLTTQASQWRVELRRVLYDVNAIKDAARRNQMPGAEGWISSWRE